MKRSDIITTLQVQFKNMRSSDAMAMLDTVIDKIKTAVADDDRIEIVHTEACKRAGIENDISSFHAGAETHIYCQHKNSKGQGSECC